MRGPGARGTIAGRWRLVRELGRGGFGTVMEAWDEKIGRKVAVKLVDRRALELAGGMHRFNREAKVLQHLAHPNVVRAFDAGEHEGTPYLVLEFLEGAPLDAALRDGGAMPVERVASIARDLLGALDEAHRFGVVHRDIKPANVFLARIAGRELVKLLDFGIAKAGGLEVGQTAMGATLGTAAYMAPEQVTGGAIVPATDLFAVGLLLAELLTGRRVYGGGSGLAILVAKASGQPVSLPPEVVASPLGAIVARAVAVSPQERYPSAREMADAIVAATAGAQPAVAGVLDPLGAPPPVVELRGSQPDAAWSAGALPAPVATAAPPHAADHAAAVTHAVPHPAVAAAFAETAPHAVLARPPRRRWIAVAVALVVLAAAAVALAFFLWPPPPARSAPRIELPRQDANLRIFDRDRVEIFPGKVEGTFPEHQLHDCPPLEGASREVVGARLAKVGPVRETYRGAIITEWTLREGQDDAAEISHYRILPSHVRGLDVATVAATLAQRLRVQGPVLRAGSSVLQLPAEGIDPAAAIAAICR